jgi:hypothetical protein
VVGADEACASGAGRAGAGWAACCGTCGAGAGSVRERDIAAGKYRWAAELLNLIRDAGEAELRPLLAGIGTGGAAAIALGDTVPGAG